MKQRTGPRKAKAGKAAKPAVQSPLLSVARELWRRLITLLRSAKIQRREKHMQLVERIAVGNKQSVVLLRVDGQEIIVGCSGETMVMLGVNEPKQFTVDLSKAVVLPKADAQTNVAVKSAEHQRESEQPVITAPTPTIIAPATRKYTRRKPKAVSPAAPWINEFSGRVWINGTDRRVQ